MTLNDWEIALSDVMPRVIELRRALHRHPEHSGQEVWTQTFIMERLTALGFRVVTFKDCYGVMGVMENGVGPCVAIRADMDALPVTEATGLPFASEIPGAMHACGHDAHMALALGTADYLSHHRGDWHGTVKLLFEPAEETEGGAQWMVAQGCMEQPQVDFVFGQHMNPRYAPGVFFCKPGFVSGASDEVKLRILGHSCHGAYPESGTDAVVIAAQVVCALQSLVSRTVSPLDSAVLSLGTVQGGTANNIICGEVKLGGTLRTLSDDTRGKLKQRIERMVADISEGMGGHGETSIHPGYGAVYNDDALYARVESVACKLLGEGRVVRREQPSLGVESFCYFLQNTPGVYYDIGSGIGTALHTPTFTVDEACLLPGVALQCGIVLDFLGKA